MHKIDVLSTMIDHIKNIHQEEKKELFIRIE